MKKIKLSTMLLLIMALPIMATISYLPVNPLPGQNVGFTMQISSRLSFSVISWNFGDGTVQTVNSKTAMHSYKQAGTYTVQVRYKFLINSNILTDTQTITITERRQILAIPNPAKPGQSIAFQAQNFYSDGLLWDFGDGQTGLTGSTAHHSYTNPGSYQVRVKEQSGDNPVTITTTVTITDNRVIAFSPAKPSPGQAISFQAQNFLDACVMWNFGDGSGNIQGTTTMSHRYSNPGTFQVSARDHCGNSQPITATVSVTENRSIVYLPKNPKTGQAISFNARNFAAACIMWDFGDGSGNIQGTSAMNHSYNRAGTYRVSARDYCGDSQPITITLTVSENRRIVVNQSPLYAGEPIYFMTQNFTNPCVMWNFGDGTALVSGQASEAHTFKNPGSYRVLAIDDCGRRGAPQAVLTVNVILGQGPQAPFRITYIKLHFEDGSTSKQIDRGFADLQAVADIKFQGTGSLMLQWLVNGQVLTSRSVPMNFAGQSTIKSGLVPPLPSQALGRHRVSLKILSPQQTLDIPSIEYTVILGASLVEAPRVTAVFPPVIHQDQEILLKLKGEHFDNQTQFNPGVGIAPIGQAFIISSEEAELKVFASREISEGPRLIKAQNKQGSSNGPGKVFVERLSEPMSVDINLPCPDTQNIAKMTLQNLRPDSYYKTTGEQNHSSPHILTNESVLSWELIGDPTAVSFYEVEFYNTQDLNTRKRLGSRRVPGHQPFLKSDFQLIEELNKARQALININIPLKKPAPCSEEYKNTFKGDVWWTVKGYQIVDCPWGTHAADTRRMIQKVSPVAEDIWPREVLITQFSVNSTEEFEVLNLPKLWTGINCPENGKNPGGVNVTNLDREKTSTVNIKTGKVTEIVDNSSYPMQRWELSGQIDTAYTPLAVSGDISWNPPAGGMMGASTVGTVVFDNIFIDWGDGCVQRLSGSPQCQMINDNNLNNGQQGCNLLKGPFDLSKAYHRYTKPGDYTVRLYQLPAGIMSNAPPSVGDPEFAILTTLGQLTKTSIHPFGAQPISSNEKPGLQNSEDMEFTQSFGNHYQEISQALNQAMDHGVLFFCQQLTITNRQDLCASGPLNLVEMHITEFPARAESAGFGQAVRPAISTSQNQISVTKAISSQIQGPQIPTASTCDGFFTANAAISYFGEGSIEVSWLVDNVPLAKETYHGLSSPPRQGLASKEAQTDCSQALLATLNIESPRLPVQEPGRRNLRIIARIITSPSDQNASRMINQAVLNHSNPVSVMPWVSQYLDNLPHGQSSKSMGHLNIAPGITLSELEEYHQTHLQKIAPGFTLNIKNAPPLILVTDAPYLVREASPGSICQLIFPTKLGDFIITNVEGRLKKTGQSYSGDGILILPFTSGSDSNKEYGIPIPISNWLIDETSGQVRQGRIDITPAKEMSQVPAVTALMSKLKGGVQNDQPENLLLTLNMEFKNKELRLPGDKAGQEKPPSWTKAEAISSDGDWKTEDSLPEILLSWSSSKLSSPQLIFDFHKKEHAPAGGPCSSTNPSWVGVDLGQVTIKPYTFDIIGTQALVLSSNGWVLTDLGICGHVESGPYTMKYKKGQISFDKVILHAGNGDFSTQYKNLTIHVPWLETDLKGDASLNKLSGQYGLNFSGVSAPTIIKQYGQFSLTASDLTFTSEQNIGWVIRSKTHFNLKSENKTITEFTVPSFFYGFDGYPYFSEGDKKYSLDLGQSSKLGDTSISLKNVRLTAHESGNKALSIAVPCEAYLSENPIIPAADTQLDYTVLIGDPLYSGTGPTVMPFTLDVRFPLGAPSISARMNPQYTPGSDSAGASGFGGPSLSEPPVPVGNFSGTRYYGNVDMAMFGGPPVAAQMLLGYQGGKSYFLVRGDIPLGPSGIPMSPLPFSLFRLSGGLGYNFPVNSFYNMSIENAQPDMSGETLFMAGMRLGSSDKFTFMMDGITTVKTSGEAGMKFDAWLLSHDHSGNGQLQGFLQYGSGAFSGKIWGNIGVLNNMVGFNLGSSEQNAALDIHLGQGDWHFYAGQRDGQRIAATLLGQSTAEAYLMLGNQVGLAVGGRQTWNLTGSDAAFVKGYMDMGLQISPQPRISGDFNAGLSAGICVPHVGCLSGGVNARVQVSALPLNMKASASLDLPGPFGGSISFTVNL